MRTSEWVRCKSQNFEDFLVSSDGKIIGKMGKIITGHITTKGYVRISNGKTKKFLHRLIAETFIPNPHNYPQINHIDGNKQNNNVTNLEWCDNSYNQKHSYLILNKPKYMQGKHHSTKTKIKISKALRGRIRSKEFCERNSLSHIGKGTYGDNPKSCSVLCVETNEVFDSIKRLSENLNMNYSTVCSKIRKQEKINGYNYIIKRGINE